MYVPALVGLHFLLDLLNIPVGHGDLAPRKKEGIKKKRVPELGVYHHEC